MLEDRGSDVGSIPIEVNVMPSRPRSLPKELNILSESEIQDRLYGAYLGKRKKPAPSAVVVPSDLIRREASSSVTFAQGSAQGGAAPAQGGPAPFQGGPGPSQGGADPEWTGLEILTGELIDLRSELLHLKDERERLTFRLNRLKRFQRSVFSLRQIFIGIFKGLFLSAVWFLDQMDRWWNGFLHQESDLMVRPVSRRLIRLCALAILVVLVAYPAGAGLLQASPMGREPTPYTVQVAIYDVKSYADRAVMHLRGMGYPAFLREFLRLNGRPRYRIYVGSFVTKEEAQLQWKQLASDQHFEDFQDAFVRFY